MKWVIYIASYSRDLLRELDDYCRRALEAEKATFRHIEKAATNAVSRRAALLKLTARHFSIVAGDGRGRAPPPHRHTILTLYGMKDELSMRTARLMVAQRDAGEVARGQRRQETRYFRATRT